MHDAARGRSVVPNCRRCRCRRHRCCIRCCRCCHYGSWSAWVEEASSDAELASNPERIAALTRRAFKTFTRQRKATIPDIYRAFNDDGGEFQYSDSGDEA